ncbi:MAG: tetratricopeptide repeat protein [Synergistaceae bacterium]|jgi:tetratricopeptide (TPR) repeat protein|nr:tetratricopeptide repeat protein [Synergistaceae bacterium]
MVEENHRAEDALMTDEQLNAEGDAPDGDGAGITSKRTLLLVAASLFLALALVGGLLYHRSLEASQRVLEEAAACFERGDYVIAMEKYSEALKMRPGTGEIFYRMAYSYEMLGRYADAVDSYAAHLENNPWDTEALVRLGGIYLRLGMYNDAVLLYEEAAERIPDDPDVRYALSVLYERLGRDEKAAESYVWLTESNVVTDPEVLISSARALMKLGQYVEALDGFTKANEFLPDDDKRAFHGMNAAKSMMGWPTDDAVVVTPGESIGNIKIGASSPDILSVWGKPVDRVAEGEHELWTYGTSSEELSTYVFFQDGRVLEIATRSKSHRTSDGLGLGNFMDPKYSERFDRWVAGDDEEVYRYILKGGGLALYSEDGATAVIYRGDVPLSTEKGRRWRLLSN